MTPRRVLPLLCMLFALEVLPLFSYRWVEDESWYSSTGYTLLHEGNIRNGVFCELDIESKADTRPIAMPVTLAAAFKTLGVGPAQARLPEFLACMATLPVAFWLGNLLLSETAGLIAALFVSVDNIFFLAARTTRPEALVTFFGSLAVLLYLLSRRRESIALAALAGLALGITFNYHVIGCAIALSIGLLLIQEFRFHLWRAPRAWVLVLASTATLIPFFLWVRGDPVRMQAFHELYAARHGRVTGGDLMRGEIIRYSDFLGIGSQRLHFLPFPVPLRLHVFLLIVAALAILAWKRRSLFWTLMILIVPSLLIWPQTANPTVRYFATVTPYFGVAMGAALVALKEAPWRRIFAVCCGLVALTEFAGNLLVLRQARTANYPQVTRELRAIVPPDARVYGAITFFLSLYDRPYYSWNRTPLDFAVQKLGVNYLVLNDRVLVHGSGYGLDDWAEVRDAAARFVRARADLVGKAPDAFYGDLEVYRVRP